MCKCRLKGYYQQEIEDGLPFLSGMCHLSFCLGAIIVSIMVTLDGWRKTAMRRCRTTSLMLTHPVWYLASRCFLLLDVAWDFHCLSTVLIQNKADQLQFLGAHTSQHEKKTDYPFEVHHYLYQNTTGGWLTITHLFGVKYKTKVLVGLSSGDSVRLVDGCLSHCPHIDFSPLCIYSWQPVSLPLLIKRPVSPANVVEWLSINL